MLIEATWMDASKLSSRLSYRVATARFAEDGLDDLGAERKGCDTVRHSAVVGPCTASVTCCFLPRCVFPSILVIPGMLERVSCQPPWPVKWWTSTGEGLSAPSLWASRLAPCRWTPLTLTCVHTSASLRQTGTYVRRVHWVAVWPILCVKSDALPRYVSDDTNESSLASLPPARTSNRRNPRCPLALGHARYRFRFA